MHSLDMSPRLKTLQSLYLEPLQAKKLDELAARTRIPKAVLLREAVDDLLAKHAGRSTGLGAARKRG